MTSRAGATGGPTRSHRPTGGEGEGGDERGDGDGTGAPTTAAKSTSIARIKSIVDELFLPLVQGL
jgi:hypothetical protein